MGKFKTENKHGLVVPTPVCLIKTLYTADVFVVKIFELVHVPGELAVV